MSLKSIICVLFSVFATALYGHGGDGLIHTQKGDIPAELPSSMAEEGAPSADTAIGGSINKISNQGGVIDGSFGNPGGAATGSSAGSSSAPVPLHSPGTIANDAAPKDVPTMEDYKAQFESAPQAEVASPRSSASSLKLWELQVQQSKSDFEFRRKQLQR